MYNFANLRNSLSELVFNINLYFFTHFKYLRVSSEILISGYRMYIFHLIHWWLAFLRSMQACIFKTFYSFKINTFLVLLLLAKNYIRMTKTK